MDLFESYYKKLEEQALDERRYSSYVDEINACIENGAADENTMAQLRNDIYKDPELKQKYGDRYIRQLVAQTYNATERQKDQQIRDAAEDAKEQKTPGLVSKIKDEVNKGISYIELIELPEMEELRTVNWPVWSQITNKYERIRTKAIINKINSDLGYLKNFAGSKDADELTAMSSKRGNNYTRLSNGEKLREEILNKFKDRDYILSFPESKDYKLMHSFYQGFPYNDADDRINSEYALVLQEYKKLILPELQNKLKEYNIDAKIDGNSLTFTVERSYDPNSKSISRDSSSSYNKQVIVRDSSGNLIYIPVNENYLMRDLNLLTTIDCDLRFSSTYSIDKRIETVHGNLGDAVLALYVSHSDIESRIEEIQDLDDEGRKDLETTIKGKKAQYNAQQYEIVKQDIKSKEDEYNKNRAQYKLTSYYVYNKAKDEFKRGVVTQEKWNEKIDFANSWGKKTDTVRKPHQHWAVTDGKIIFANAATAMIYNGWNPREGNHLYDACSGFGYGTDPWTTSNWRYATAYEIEKAEPLNWDMNNEKDVVRANKY